MATRVVQTESRRAHRPECAEPRYIRKEDDVPIAKEHGIVRGSALHERVDDACDRRHVIAEQRFAHCLLLFRETLGGDAASGLVGGMHLEPLHDVAEALPRGLLRQPRRALRRARRRIVEHW